MSPQSVPVSKVTLWVLISTHRHSCATLLSTYKQQEGILNVHASIWAVEFLRIGYVHYQHLQAVFWR